MRARLEHARGVGARPPSLVLAGGGLLCVWLAGQWLGASDRLILSVRFPRGSVEPLTVLDAVWFRQNWFASERAESSVSP